MNRPERFIVATCMAAVFATGCVTTGAHEKALAELQQKQQRELDEQGAQRAALEKKLADTEAARAALEKKQADTEAARQDLEAQLAAAKLQADELKKVLEGNTTERAQLNKLLAASGAQLAELNKQKAAAEARAATYRALTQRLRSMIDTGKLSVKIRKGRMLISLPNDVLFDSGSAQLKKAGKEAIAQVAQALASFTDRQFLVAGHTDDQPIHSARFPSNWELSTQRAVDVTRFLVERGMKPELLGAVGYGEFDPLVPNDSDEHRAQNRRIEIQLQPNLSELPAMDDLAK